MVEHAESCQRVAQAQFLPASILSLIRFAICVVWEVFDSACSARLVTDRHVHVGVVSGVHSPYDVAKGRRLGHRREALLYLPFGLPKTSDKPNKERQERERGSHCRLTIEYATYSRRAPLLLPTSKPLWKLCLFRPFLAETAKKNNKTSRAFAGQ